MLPSLPKRPFRRLKVALDAQDVRNVRMGKTEELFPPCVIVLNLLRDHYGKIGEDRSLREVSGPGALTFQAQQLAERPIRKSRLLPDSLALSLEWKRAKFREELESERAILSLDHFNRLRACSSKMGEKIADAPGGSE